MKKIVPIFTILLLGIDQGSKFLFEKILKDQVLTIIPHFFELNLVYNTGAAWSMFAGNVWFLIVISFFLLAILIYIYPTISDSKVKITSFILLYAGILGNLIDRLLFGYVRDFFSIQFFHYAFPIFNFADIFIVCGTLLFVFLLWREEK